MPKWTPRQQQAITARNKEILVSAAAGSGKTAVLIERVMSLLKEGMQLDRMLVMTFTHAAADEMKERLTDLLSQNAEDNEHLRKQYAALGRADISTLHSFCMRVIKAHFQAVGTDPMSKLADESLADELKTAALDETLDQAHETPTEDFISLTDRFKEDEIITMVRNLYAFLMSQEAPFEWLDRMIDNSPIISLYEHPWYKVMTREACLMLQGAEELARTGLEICHLPLGPARYIPALTDDLNMARLLRERIQGEERFTWNTPNYTKLSGRKKTDPEEDEALVTQVKDRIRKDIKELIKKALELLPQNELEAEKWAAGLASTLPQLRALSALVKATHENYQEKKAAKALWDFNDLEHLALKALNDPKVQMEAASSYDALFVDEYQDTSQIQEAIIGKLHGEGNTLFMVGDVKQSIYRFRLADPLLFLNKYKRFSTEENAPSRLINLKENFRSNKNILTATNLVFEHAMQEEATELRYDEEASLSTLRDDEFDPPVELWLLTRGEDTPEEELLDDVLVEDEPEDATEEEGDAAGATAAGDKGEMERAFVYEARLIARRIKELIGRDIRDGEGTRDIQFRDFAILLRSAANRAPVMAEIFNTEDIPTYSDADGEFYTQSDVRDVINILRVLDNPLQDVPLLSALASPAFAFTPEELTALRLYAQGRENPLHRAFFELAKTEPRFAAARDKLDKWRLMAQTMPLERFIAYLLRDSGLYMVAGAKEDGTIRRANLRILVSRAAPAPQPQNLSDFVERALRQMKQKSRDRSASLGMSENVVRIMTMHKSKGLQFPIVFLPDLASNFSGKRSSPNLRMDAQTGLALMQIDPKRRVKTEGFGIHALKTKKNREELSEEARLLYVGMTRAKEKLILIGAPDKPDAGLSRWSLPSGPYSAGSAKSMLDWVANPLYEQIADKRDGLYHAKNGSRWQIAWKAVETLKEAPLTAVQSLPHDIPPAKDVPEDLFVPLPGYAETVQKSSVTSLLRKAVSDEQEEETPETKRREYAARELRPLRLATSANQLSGAQKGAAVHKALGALNPGDFVHLPEADMKDAINRALDNLLSSNRLLKQEREAIEADSLARFYQSALAKRMADSPEYHAEWPFTMEIENQMILQGVLDACFMEDGQWVLVDYKTDRGSREELLALYTDQMRWYKRALYDITGIPVKEAWLYLIRHQEAVPVKETAPIALKTAGAGIDADAGR